MSNVIGCMATAQPARRPLHRERTPECADDHDDGKGAAHRGERFRAATRNKQGVGQVEHQHGERPGDARQSESQQVPFYISLKELTHVR